MNWGDMWTNSAGKENILYNFLFIFMNVFCIFI